MEAPLFGSHIIQDKTSFVTNAKMTVCEIAAQNNSETSAGSFELWHAQLITLSIGISACTA